MLSEGEVDQFHAMGLQLLAQRLGLSLRSFLFVKYVVELPHEIIIGRPPYYLPGNHSRGRLFPLRHEALTHHLPADHHVNLVLGGQRWNLLT